MMYPKKVDHGRYILTDGDAPHIVVDGARIELRIGDRVIATFVEERPTLDPNEQADRLVAFIRACLVQDRGSR